MTDRSIYEEVSGPLMRFAASLVGPDAASDLVSEVMVATLQRRSLVSLENPQAYLMQAVLNRARSAGRRLDRERRALARYPVATVGEDPADFLVDADVVRTVAALPLQQRAAIYFVYWADLEPSEAAELLGVRPATLRRYLHLARKKLRRHFDA
ncbi:MAG: sigma-70 family RNA polymerase sigma factor [Acidimicrobiia bacterium]